MTGERNCDARFDAIPHHVLEICRVLSGAGEGAWLVGGSVRDLLRGVAPLDWDLATTARPSEMMELFRRVVPTGIAHGTVTVLRSGHSVEVTTLRGDGAYSDGRRPDEVVFLDDIEADLARRDFTVNAIAWDPIARVLLDPFGGRADLARGLIRAVGDPAARFAEDGLRVLRAARFAAALEMDIHPDTLAAMTGATPNLARVSSERKRDELSKTLMAPVPSRGLALMGAIGALPYISARLGELSRDPGAWRATLARVDAVRARELRFAALLVDLGPAAAKVLDALKLDRAQARRAAHLVDLARPGYHPGWTDGEVRRYLARVGRDAIGAVLELVSADVVAAGEPAHIADHLAARARAVEEAGNPLALADLAVSGRDLVVELEMAPGPEIGRLLEALLEHVLDAPGDNARDVLLTLARARRRGSD